MSDEVHSDWPDEPQPPFRWDVRRREQLGSLLDGWIPTIDDDFLTELIRCCARTVAFCSDGDLWFVGRSPDPLFDFLSGALEGTTWEGRLHQLPVSLRGTDWLEAGPEVREAFRRYLERLELTPRMMSGRERPTTLVDMVATGGTFGELVRHWHAWSSDLDVPWVEVQRKLHLVGIVARTETSPKTWRWQQHATWTRLLPARSIRNVSAPDWLIWEISGGDKASQSFPPSNWSDPRAFMPSRHPSTLEGLRVAVYLYETGRSAPMRQRLASELTATPGVSAAWLRSLVVELRARGGRAGGFMPSPSRISPRVTEREEQERRRERNRRRRPIWRKAPPPRPTEQPQSLPSATEQPASHDRPDR